MADPLSALASHVSLASADLGVEYRAFDPAGQKLFRTRGITEWQVDALLGRGYHCQPSRIGYNPDYRITGSERQ